MKFSDDQSPKKIVFILDVSWLARRAWHMASYKFQNSWDSKHHYNFAVKALQSTMTGFNKEWQFMFDIGVDCELRTCSFSFECSGQLNLKWASQSCFE